MRLASIKIFAHGGRYHHFHMGLVAITYLLTQDAPSKAIQFKLSKALSVHLTVHKILVVWVYSLTAKSVTPETKTPAL
jgi:hypothetical protein